MKRPLGVLVCGSNYGRNYLEAIDRDRATYRAVALLARGSLRSRRLADSRGIPLITRVDEIPPVCDIACAALSSAASGLLPSLSERGLHVLCEHPIRPGVLERSLETATARNVRFHVNGHFSEFSAPRRFLERFATLRSSGGPWFLHVTTTDRFLFGVLDTMARGMGVLSKCTVERIDEKPPFRVLSGTVDGITTVLQVQVSGARQERLEDGSHEYLADMRIAAGFADGTLVLESLGGPVTFSDSLSLDAASRREREYIGGRDRHDLDDLEEQRVAANLKALDRLVQAAETGTSPSHQHPDVILGVARIWEALGDLL